MHFLLGNSHMESGSYENVIHSFECAGAYTRPHAEYHVLDISLVSFPKPLGDVHNHHRFDRYLGGSSIVST